MVHTMRGTTRTVTTLFTDIVGSTELAASLEASSADRLRGRHFAGLRSALAVHRGREVKTLGDGFMAIFDSATDGLACAVTMQRGVARENETRGETMLSMRVGLSTGEVTEEDGDYFGVPVIEASRLCAAAGPAQILTTELVQMLVGGGGIHRLTPIGPMTLKGLPTPVSAFEVEWDAEEDFALRVALADDSVLLRQGVAQVLEAEGLEVVLQTSDAETLLEQLPAVRAHVAVLDVRMPPTHTTEGLDAAERIREEHPDVGVVVLSAEVHASAARRLLGGGTNGVGYLLKERVADAAELTAAIRTVASGGSAIDPAVVEQLSTAV
jgi:class 3 adenylate cyclase/ActR/RegA family two-component response regulator